MKRYNCYLKELYKEREGMQLKWPPVLMKDYVNVLCIESTNEPDKDVTMQLLHGDIEKVKKTRTPINLSDIASTKDSSRPKCIVVQGAPGSGKTCFHGRYVGVGDKVTFSRSTHCWSCYLCEIWTSRMLVVWRICSPMTTSPFNKR